MSKERAQEMYKAYLTAADKLDYFMIGISAASLGYAVQQYKPHQLIQWVDFLEPISMVLLLASIYYGLQRAESMIESSRYNYIILDANALVADIDKALSLPTNRAPRIHVFGRIIEGAQALTDLKEEQIARIEESKMRNTLIKDAGRMHYRWRGGTLLAAMTLLTLHRLLVPYFA